VRDILSSPPGAGSAFAQKLGARGIAELRARSAQELFETRAVMFPTVDGWLLPDTVSTLFSEGREAPVPLLAGWNANERASLPQATSLAAYQQSVRRRFEANADRVLAAYPARERRGGEACQQDPVRRLIPGVGHLGGCTLACRKQLSD
jgi:para-nitrobenzyl esterase